MEKCPTETYTPLGMAKLGAERIKAKIPFLICYAFCCQICVEKCPTETYTPLGMAKLGAEPEPLIKARMAFLIFYAFCPLDLCGEVPDGDVHPAGYGQARRGAGAAHQGERWHSYFFMLSAR